MHASVYSIGSSVFATYYTSQLTLTELNEVNGVGDHWYQVRLENGIPLKDKSDILTIGPTVEYQDLKHCMAGIGQAIEQVRCLQITTATSSYDALSSHYFTNTSSYCHIKTQSLKKCSTKLIFER